MRYELQSKELGCSTTITVYYPPAAEQSKVSVRFKQLGLRLHNNKQFLPFLGLDAADRECCAGYIFPFGTDLR